MNKLKLFKQKSILSDEATELNNQIDSIYWDDAFTDPPSGFYSEKRELRDKLRAVQKQIYSINEKLFA